MSTSPVPPKADNTALYVVLGVFGGFLFLCVAPAIIIVVCLAAIQVLGQNASMTFQTVAVSIGSTVPADSATPGEQEQARKQADAFARALLEKRYADAFDLGSPDFFVQSSAEALQRLWDEQPVLRRRNGLSYAIAPSGAGSRNRHTFQITWKDRGEQDVRMTVEMTRSLIDEWEVNRCTIP